MTGLALDLSKNGMTTMGEENMIRLFVKAFPGNLLSSSPKLPDLFLLRTFCDRLFMTLQAGGDVRHSGEGLGFEIGVAGVTFQPLCQMFLMIERDRLSSLGTKTQADEEE
jgi:hypothetical protein